jgi:hypothetical protein
VTVAVIFDELGLMTVTVPAAWPATYIAMGVTAMSNGSAPGGLRLALPEMRLLWVSTVDTLPGLLPAEQFVY